MYIESIKNKRLYCDFSDFGGFSAQMLQRNHSYFFPIESHHLWLQIAITCFETGRKSVLLRMKGIIHTMRVKLGVFFKKVKNKAQIYAGFSTCMFQQFNVMHHQIMICFYTIKYIKNSLMYL